jgi:hypothetical protein
VWFEGISDNIKQRTNLSNQERFFYAALSDTKIRIRAA